MSVGALAVRETAIPGLLIVELPVHGDARGWFKENWQRAKMVAAGLPDFGPVQQNVSFNGEVGTTRGLHAEPWDKLVSLTHGRIFGAWVDLRPGPGFGTLVTQELGPDKAVFVPRGVANGYQALEPDTVYSYLVNRHWSPEVLTSYTYLNLADETVAIDWPLAFGAVSEADLNHPRLADVTPMAARPTVIVGAGGQLGKALQAVRPDAVALGRPTLDLTDPGTLNVVDWSQVGLIINASAYTAVDAAESVQGRRECWELNVTGLGRLVAKAREFGIPMVHVSSDYVFDGTVEVHVEGEPVSPLGVYGQTKAAGEVLVSTLPQHWIVRTSWLVGDGSNFVRTMVNLADRGVSPSVVADQFGRLTFADDLAAGIVHLAGSAPPGVYHLTSDGPAQTWADIARRIFELRGRSADDVRATTTAEFAAGRLTAPRPRHSTLDLAKVRATGFASEEAERRLEEYVAGVPTPPVDTR